MHGRAGIVSRLVAVLLTAASFGAGPGFAAPGGRGKAPAAAPVHAAKRSHGPQRTQITRPVVSGNRMLPVRRMPRQRRPGPVATVRHVSIPDPTAFEQNQHREDKPAPPLGTLRPQIAALVPPNGAQDVDASTSSLSVTFDRDMAPISSFTGEGQAFPKTRGKAYFVDERTCVLPVSLEPGRSYELSVSPEDSRVRRFCSAAGMPMKPVLWRFRTAGAPIDHNDGLPPDEFSRRCREAWQDLERHVELHYAYADLMGIDWSGRFGEYRRKALAARDTAEWVRIAAAMLSETKDRQIRLEYKGRSTAVADPQDEQNWNDDVSEAGWPAVQRVNGTIVYSKKPNGVGLLRISSIAADTAKDFDNLPAVMSELWDTQALILDLRKVTDGPEETAVRIAGWFTPDRRVYAGWARRDIVRYGGWGEEMQEWLEPTGNLQYYDHPVIVLSGNMLVGGGERLLMMLSACPKVVVVGAPTGGSADRPEAIELANGVTLRMPMSRVTLPDGVLVKKEGVAPDRIVAPAADVFAESDPVFEKGMDLARRAAGVVVVGDATPFADPATNRLKNRAPRASSRVSRVSLAE